MHGSTNILKLAGRLPSISESVQYDIHSDAFQRLDAIENIYHAAIIGRIRHIERDDMYCMILDNLQKLGNDG